MFFDFREIAFFIGERSTRENCSCMRKETALSIRGQKESKIELSEPNSRDYDSFSTPRYDFGGSNSNLKSRRKADGQR